VEHKQLLTLPDGSRRYICLEGGPILFFFFCPKPTAWQKTENQAVAWGAE